MRESIFVQVVEESGETIEETLPAGLLWVGKIEGSLGRLVDVSPRDGSHISFPFTHKWINLATLPLAADLRCPASDCPYLFSWQDAVDLAFSSGPLQTRLRLALLPPDLDASTALVEPPSPDWTFAHDQALIE
jgi:hypothetical protein